MRVDTALTAFSMTTLMIIVVLVVMTATDLGITNPVTVGNYYANIPQIGGVSRSTIPLTMVKVNNSDPQCYQKGVSECKRMNSGENFVTCQGKVLADCGQNMPLLTSCYLPAGFELKYSTSQECSYGVMDECKARCSEGMRDICNKLSSQRCGLIGGRFQSASLQTRYVGYGSLT
jgi:hypothetical protein